MRSRLRGVDDHDRTALVRPGGELAHRVDRPERVGDEVRGDDLHLARALDLVQRVELQLARLVDRDGLERRARAPSDVLPRDEARMVLEIRDDDDVAGAEVVEPPRIRHQIQRLGRAPREDDLALRRRVDEAGDLAPRRLVAGRRALGEPVDAAMDVRVRVLVEVAHRIEHLARLLRRRGRVEERHRPAVHELVEHGEVGAQAVRVQLGLRRYGHVTHRTPEASPYPRSTLPLSKRARRRGGRAAPSATAFARSSCTSSMRSRSDVSARRRELVVRRKLDLSPPERTRAATAPRSGASTSLSVTSRSSPNSRSASSTAAASAESSTSSIGVTRPVLKTCRPSARRAGTGRRPRRGC